MRRERRKEPTRRWGFPWSWYGRRSWGPDRSWRDRTRHGKTCTDRKSRQTKQRLGRRTVSNHAYKGQGNYGQRTQEAGIGNAGKDFDSSPLDGDDPGGRGGVTGVGDEPGVIVRADQTEDEDTDDVEQEDTDPDSTNRAGDVLSRVAGLCCGHSENLGSQEGVGSIDQDRPDTGETAQRS